PLPARETAREPAGAERSPAPASPTAERKPVLEAVTPAAGKLAVQFNTERPHGRLGLLWILVLIPAAVVGREWLAAVLAITAVVGACQAVASRRSRGQHPVLILSAVTALALPMAAVAGLNAAALAAAGGAGLTLVVWVFIPRYTSPGDIVATLAIGGALGLAAASPVLLREFRLDLTLLLLTCASVYDAGAYLVGTGASYAWEGPAAGVVALIPVTIFSAVVLVPPLGGGAPFLLGLLAAALAPLGPLVGTALIGTPDADVPGLRRLDSLVVLGPLWAAAAAAMV
ncbi:MAG: hypothetical protein M3179_02145, partial [Actinomycetota bacterium]|nr:hypothetical protein [Actinomycetota bacterium]